MLPLSDYENPRSWVFEDFLTFEPVKEKMSFFLNSLIKSLEADFIQLTFDSESEKCNSFYGVESSDSIFLKNHSDNFQKFTNTYFTEDNKTIVNRKELEIIGQDPIFLKTFPYEVIIFIPLFIAEKCKGTIILCYLGEEVDSSDIIDQLTNELSLLMFRHHNEERIQFLENEKKFISATANSLAGVENQKELSEIIHGQLKEHINFSGSGIYVLDHDQSAFFLYSTDSANIEKMDLFNPSVKFSKKNTGAPQLDEYELSPYLIAGRTPGAKGIRFKFSQNDTEIGHWILLFEEEHILKPDLIVSLRIITDLLFATVLRLRANERLSQRANENAIIQSLHLAFAVTHDKNELLKILRLKLRSLFSFGDTFVGVINEDNITLSLFLPDTDSGTKLHPDNEDFPIATYPTNDRIISKVLLSKIPVIFDLDELAERGHMPAYFRSNYDNGIKNIVMTALQVGTRITGVWAICLQGNQFLETRQLELVKDFSNHLSIAVDNIKSNESVKVKEIERDRLLAFSYDITRIRNKADLLNVINKNLPGLFSYENITVLGLKNTEEALPAFMISTAHQSVIDAGANNLINRLHNYHDHCLDKIRSCDGIVTFDLEELVRLLGTADYIRSEFKNGIREKTGIALRIDHKTIGALYINTKKKDAYTEHQLELIKGVSYQLSTAVSNILANEEIQRRQRERDTLLSLSIEIAAVRNNAELLKVITIKLKKLFGLSHSVIGIINNDDKTTCAYLLDPEAKTNSHPNYEIAATTRYSMDDGILDKAFHTREPLLFDLSELYEERSLPLYLQVNFESGMRYMVIIRLARGDEVFGFWLLFFEKTYKLTDSESGLIVGLANQISISVSNIIANDEIQRRNQEKTRLLSFGNTIAFLREKAALGKVLKQQLSDYFSIQDYCIYAFSDNKQILTPLLYDSESLFVDYPDAQGELIYGKNISNDLFTTITTALSPFTFEIRKLGDQSKTNLFLQPIQNSNIHQLTAVVLQVGNERVGLLLFGHKDFTKLQINQRYLFRSICNLLGIAVSNIVANDKVNNQLKAINQYKQQLEEEKIYLKEEIASTQNPSDTIGKSLSMQKIFRMVDQVAPSDSTVLILGETGTGKELIARAIHNNSSRKTKLMVKVNCATLPANLIESELFGHERGSFTGATERRLGKFELANNGTLFLDEIGEMPLELQVKLLRALQEREIERIGGKDTIKVNVRVIAATNRDLDKEMAEGRFRSDLFYRLNIFPIKLPPLRERKEDIPLLTTHFTLMFAKKLGRNIDKVNSSVLQDLLQYDWPGNIREMEHLIERSILLTTGDTIKQIHLPPLRQDITAGSLSNKISLKTIDENERDHIYAILKYCNGRIAGNGGAAEILGVPTSTLNSKIRRLHIKREHILKP